MSLGELLLQRKKITASQLETGMDARKSNERIEQTLVRLGFVDERDYLEIYGEQLSIPLIDLSAVELDEELLKLAPSKVVHCDRVIPIDRHNGAIRVATNNPFNLYAFDELRMLMGAKIETVLATQRNTCSWFRSRRVARQVLYSESKDPSFINRFDTSSTIHRFSRTKIPFYAGKGNRIETGLISRATAFETAPTPIRQRIAISTYCRIASYEFVDK